MTANAAGLFNAYGLFWHADEVNWSPGSGNATDVTKQFRLLGRRGKNQPGVRVADFRDQRGIYILYGNHGAHYVGLTRYQALGKRLKDHLSDSHKGKWERFSWFGFCAVLEGTDDYGFQRLKKMPSLKVTETDTRDIQERLTRALRRHFAGIDVDLNPLGETGRISGVLVWDGFRGREFVDRQEEVWREIRAALGPDAERVSTLVTLTPIEAACDE